MIFIDSGAFIGWFFPRDQHHRAAVNGWKRLQQAATPLYTTELVFAEVVNFMTYRLPAGSATEAARQIMSITRLEMVSCLPAEPNHALDLMDGYADQRFSFTDAVSFVVMRRLGLRYAFTFDHHFEVAGFETWNG